jgi:TRAP-type C4-dicarboxylate transport system permease small subunit
MVVEGSMKQMKRWEKWAFAVIMAVVLCCSGLSIACGVSGAAPWPKAVATALFGLIVAVYAVIVVRSVSEMRRGVPKERW